MTKPVFRADHIGSLLRPTELLAARAAKASGRLSLEQLREVENGSVLDALAMQRSVGLPIFSDGEMRRENWYLAPMDAIEGLELIETRMIWRKVDGTDSEVVAPAAVASGKLKARGRFTEVESRFLAEKAGGAYKITLPSPGFAAMYFQPGRAPGIYDRLDQLMLDVISIWIKECAGLVADGAAYIQLDEGFTLFTAHGWKERIEQMGTTREAMLAGAIAAENAVWDTLPRDTVVRSIHICQGNSQSRYASTGSYEFLAEQVFNGLHVDRFLLEYDSDRAGGFEPLRHIPAGKVAVLGLVTTKVGKLETEDLLLRRIEEATRYCPIERLALSPQCGFASSKEGNDIAQDEQRRKLELVVRVAEKVWGSLT
jgi:5-methyltetrahydropteroyltriglutamate--homocysteine methyltransferase